VRAAPCSRRACSRTNARQVYNHGLPQADVDAVFAASGEFFALPDDAWRQVQPHPSGVPRSTWSATSPTPAPWPCFQSPWDQGHHVRERQGTGCCSQGPGPRGTRATGFGLVQLTRLNASGGLRRAAHAISTAFAGICSPACSSSA
jgi:isopenicillin N synthase-like dioxygenase